MTVSSHSGLGLGIVMFSGVLTASFPVPMKFSRAWKWENTWLAYATMALVVIPLALAWWSIPDLFSIYASLPARDLLLPLLFGFGWGIAQVTFGLSIACVGMAMSFAIVIGMSALLGSVIPLAIFHPEALGGRRGTMLAVSALLLVCGLVFYARAGRQREAASSAVSSPDGQFAKGLLLSIFTGLFGAMLNLGFVFGGKIADQAMLRGVSAGRATLAIWAVVLAAGYIPNAAYTIYLLRKNRSAGAFRKLFVVEILLALAAAVFWLFGMLGYGIGAAAMGTYGNSIGFAVCMTVLLLWSSALGLLAGEWRGSSLGVRARMAVGVVFITASMVTLGFDSLLH